jgi:hypothetical protein
MANILIKREVNAIYYALEANYIPDKGYPEVIPDNLKGIDPESLKDENNLIIGDPKSNYKYERYDCYDGYCKHYKIKAELKNQAEFIKNSQN